MSIGLPAEIHTDFQNMDKSFHSFTESFQPVICGRFMSADLLEGMQFSTAVEIESKTLVDILSIADLCDSEVQ